MTDEIKLNQAIARQARAEALLRDEILIEALDTTTRTYLDLMVGSKPSEQELRERYYGLIQAARMFRSHLTSVINNGKISQKQLDLLTAVDRRKSFEVI